MSGCSISGYRQAFKITGRSFITVFQKVEKGLQLVQNLQRNEGKADFCSLKYFNVLFVLQQWFCSGFDINNTLLQTFLTPSFNVEHFNSKYQKKKVKCLWWQTNVLL